jgi:hypothetical protein
LAVLPYVELSVVLSRRDEWRGEEKLRLVEKRRGEGR